MRRTSEPSSVRSLGERRVCTLTTAIQKNIGDVAFAPAPAPFVSMKEIGAQYRVAKRKAKSETGDGSTTRLGIEPMRASREHVDARAAPFRHSGAGATPLLTIDEVATMLNVSTRFVRRLVAERRITFHKIGHYVRFDACDGEAWIAAGRVQIPTSAHPPR